MIDRTRFRVSELLLSALTLLGISLIFHFDATYQLGIVLGVISSAFAALYTIYSGRLVRKYDSKVMNFYQMAGGTVGLGVLMPVYLYFFPAAELVPGMQDTKKIPAFTVNLSFNLEPIYAITLAFIFFNEAHEVNLSFYIGLGFVMISVLLQSLWPVKR